MRQQQQQLQTGAAGVQSAQAKATVDTQAANENQNLAKLLADPVGNGIVDAQGNPTPTAQSTIMRVAPTTGADNYEKVVNAAKTKVAFNQSINNLNANERQEVGGMFAGAAAGAKSVDEIRQAATNFLSTKQGLPTYDDFSTIVNTGLKAINHVDDKQKQGGQIIPVGGEAGRQAALSLGRQVIGAAGVVGAGGIGNPQAVTTNAGLVNRDQIGGELSPPPGGAPGTALNPTPPQVAGATTRQTGTGNADIDTSNLVVAAQKDARTNIDLTKRIDQLADVVSPGQIPAKVSQGLGALGLQDVNQARTELQKDLGRLRGAVATRAGSDSRAGEVLAGLPTDTTPTQTIHQAMDFARGSARQDLALGQLRQKTSTATQGQMNGFQGDYAHAVGAASPLMHEYYSLSPQEQVGFFQRNFKTKEQARAFRAQAESVKRLSPDVVGQ